MNTNHSEQLVSYVLGCLDEESKREVEAALAAQVELQAQLAMVRRFLEPLSADRTPIPIPADLATKTLAKLAEELCKPMPRSAPSRPYAGNRSWWRRTDVVVAGALTALGLGMVFPLLLYLRSAGGPPMVAECKDHLKTFHTALTQYQEANGNYPDVSRVASSPRNVAGMLVPMLVESEFLGHPGAVQCPGAGTFDDNFPALEALRNMTEAEFNAVAHRLLPVYAYHLGFRDANGVYHSPGKVADKEWTGNTPLMADGPPVGIFRGNSPNHQGKGQNVLFGDGHVKFMKDRAIAGDDIFTNKDKRVAAGVDAKDVVLGGSTAKPLD